MMSHMVAEESYDAAPPSAAAVSASSPIMPARMPTERGVDELRTRRQQNKHMRAYVACIHCRTRKVKCVIGDQPPCTKCRREHRDCVFDSHRTTAKRRDPPRWTRRSDEIRSSPKDVRHPPPLSPAHNNQANGYSTDRADLLQPPDYETVESSGDSLVGRRVTESLAGSRASFTDRVMSTVMTRTSDVLEVLFDAAQSQQQPDLNPSDTCSENFTLHASSAPAASNSGRFGETSTSSVTVPSDPLTLLSRPTEEVMDIWDKCRFVRQGWLTAQEAVTYLDLFFQNMAHLTPILTKEYSNHSNHYRLVTEEPMLCCTLLMISSRYHVLPGVGSVSRGYFIHQRVWQYCEHLINRVIFGQEKYSTAKTRTIGTIESFLLISEWHPRAMHFPPETEGWDAELISTGYDRRHRAATQDDSPLIRWREDVFEPAKRSDRMSWMLLGAANNLAYELGIFTDDVVLATSDPTQLKHLRIRKLLYVYVTQLAVRLGCSSLLPQTISSTTLGNISSAESTPADQQWDIFMDLWIDMTRLTKTASAMFFPSTTATKQLLLNGRYVTLLEHFAPSVETWHEVLVASHKNLSKHFIDMLFIEYQYLKVYTNSLAIQAVVERALSRGIRRIGRSQGDILATCVDSQDYKFIREVVSGSRQILQTGTALLQSGYLRFSPMRTLLRITSSSVFLLKAISLGSRHGDLQASLSILDQSTAALRANPVDDMDLASRYATLIERHVTRFRHNFTVPYQPEHHLRPPEDSSGAPRTEPHRSPLSSSAGTLAPIDIGLSFPVNPADQGEQSCDIYGIFNPSVLDDWMAQPFDPSIAPFGTSGYQMSLGFEIDSLDFLWNIPPS